MMVALVVAHAVRLAAQRNGELVEAVMALPLEAVPDLSGFGVDGRGGLECAQHRRGALVDQTHVAGVQFDRTHGVGLVDGLAPPGSLGDRDRCVVAGEGLIDDEAQDRRLGSDGGEDRRSGDAGLGGDVLDRRRQVALGRRTAGRRRRRSAPVRPRVEWWSVRASLDSSHRRQSYSRSILLDDASN